MIFGQSPDGRRWHIIDDGLTACHRSRTGGKVSSQWDTITRLPPASDSHCEVCFPWHTPPVVPVTVTDWDLDAFIASL